MHVLGVVGPSDAGKTTFVERLVDALDERGTVATVKHLTHAPDVDTDGKDTARHRDAGAAVTYGLTDSVGWFATGETRSLGETLDRLAPDYEYALVEGFSGADIPQVVLGGGDATGDVIATGRDADDVSVGAVVERLEETDHYETLESLVQRVKHSPKAPRSGAIATFTGRVRAKDSPEDDPTTHLEFERYDEVASERMDALRADLMERDGVFDVRLHHRTGVIEYGEDIVFVVVLAGHRDEAFRTVEDGINRLKDEVPIFKKEATVDEEFWVHDRA